MRRFLTILLAVLAVPAVPVTLSLLLLTAALPAAALAQPPAAAAVSTATAPVPPIVAHPVTVAPVSLTTVALPPPAEAPGDEAGAAAVIRSRGAPALFRSELEQPDTLGVGRIAGDVASNLPAVDAMAAYLDGRIGGLGYARARPVIARNNAEMIEFLKRGIVDLVSGPPLSAIRFVRDAGASIQLRERRRGQAGYSSVLFVLDGSPIRTMADLPGRRVAFEDGGSTTAFLLPLAGIKRSGNATIALAPASEAVATDRVGYFFVLSEADILRAVTLGVADAGAVSNEDWQTIREKRQDHEPGLRLLEESETVPRALVVTGPHVSTLQARGLRRVLLSMHEDAAGREALRRYDEVDAFDAADAAPPHSAGSLEATYDLVRSEMN